LTKEVIFLIGLCLLIVMQVRNCLFSSAGSSISHLLNVLEE